MSEVLGRPGGAWAALKLGFSFVRDYLGVVALTALVSLALSVFAGLSISQSLVAHFGESVLFDAVADGDIGAMAMIIEAMSRIWVASLWSTLSFVAFYMALSWFLSAGIMEVARVKPQNRRLVCETFGYGALVGGWRFFRLSLIATIPWAVTLTAIGVGWILASKALEGELSLAVFVVKGIGYLLPGLALALLTSTLVGVSRAIMMSQDHPAAGGAFLKALRVVIRRPTLVAQAAVSPAGWLLLTALYVFATGRLQGFGVSSAFAIFIFRQLIVFFRHAASVSVMAAQVAWIASSGLDLNE